MTESRTTGSQAAGIAAEAANGGTAPSDRIVIIGGGFAGVELARRLERQLPATQEIVVISAENHMVFTPMLPEVAARTLNPLHVVVTGREMTRRTRWMKARVTRVHTETSELTYEDDRGEEHRISYGQLVVACGAVVNLDAIPGMAAHAYPLKSIGDAFTLGNALIGLCEDASICQRKVETSYSLQSRTFL